MPNLNFRKENALGHLILTWETSDKRDLDYCTFVCDDHVKRLPIQRLENIKNIDNNICGISGCRKVAVCKYHFNE